MICPHCESTFDARLRSCPECRSPLVHALPAEPPAEGLPYVAEDPDPVVESRRFASLLPDRRS